MGESASSRAESTPTASSQQSDNSLSTQIDNSINRTSPKSNSKQLQATTVTTVFDPRIPRWLLPVLLLLAILLLLTGVLLFVFASGNLGIFYSVGGVMLGLGAALLLLFSILFVFMKCFGLPTGFDCRCCPTAEFRRKQQKPVTPASSPHQLNEERKVTFAESISNIPNNPTIDTTVCINSAQDQQMGIQNNGVIYQSEFSDNGSPYMEPGTRVQPPPYHHVRQMHGFEPYDTVGNRNINGNRPYFTPPTARRSQTLPSSFGQRGVSQYDPPEGWDLPPPEGFMCETDVDDRYNQFLYGFRTFDVRNTPSQITLYDNVRRGHSVDSLATEV